MLRGNFGYSFFWNRPVADLVTERLGFTLLISGTTIVFSYVAAIAIGVYSATRQYGIGDYLATVFGFLGLSTPPFLVALVLVYLLLVIFNVNVVGLFSPDYLKADWSVARVLDMLGHLPVPVLVIGLGGIAGLQRIMRATLLDELRKQYVITARAKGVEETRLLFKYPVRVAINPIVSTVAWVFPELVSGGAIVAVVLNLPTMGAAAAVVAARPGHVSGRRHHDPAQHDDRGGVLPLRPAADADRSAYPDGIRQGHSVAPKAMKPQHQGRARRRALSDQ